MPDCLKFPSAVNKNTFLAVLGLQHKVCKRKHLFTSTPSSLKALSFTFHYLYSSCKLSVFLTASITHLPSGFLHRQRLTALITRAPDNLSLVFRNLNTIHSVMPFGCTVLLTDFYRFEVIGADGLFVQSTDYKTAQFIKLLSDICFLAFILAPLAFTFSSIRSDSFVSS